MNARHILILACVAFFGCGGESVLSPASSRTQRIAEISSLADDTALFTSKIQWRDDEPGARWHALSFDDSTNMFAAGLKFIAGEFDAASAVITRNGGAKLFVSQYTSSNEAAAVVAVGNGSNLILTQDGTLFITDEEGTVVANGIRTNDIHTSLFRPLVKTPSGAAIAGVTESNAQIIGFDAAFNAAWTNVYPSNAHTPVLNSLAFDSTGAIFAAGRSTTNEAWALAVNESDGSAIWSVGLTGTNAYNIVFANDTLYVTTGFPPMLIALDSSGTVLWEHELPFAFEKNNAHSHAVLETGTIVVAGSVLTPRFDNRVPDEMDDRVRQFYDLALVLVSDNGTQTASYRYGEGTGSFSTGALISTNNTLFIAGYESAPFTGANPIDRSEGYLGFTIALTNAE